MTSARRRWGPAPWIAIVVALPLAAAAPAGAQSSDPVQPDRPPGWTITPAVAVAELWDDNPTLGADGDVRVSDYVTAVRPSLDLGYRGRRTLLSLDYGGSFDYYRELTGLNTHDHRAAIDFTHRLTRRVELFARDSASLSPTTGGIDEISATVLRRQTTRMNAFRGGIEGALSRHTTLTAAYSNQWVDFDRLDDGPAVPTPAPLPPLPPLASSTDDVLLGGVSHGAIAGLRHRLSPRVTIGGDYEYQHALVAGGSDEFAVSSALAVTELALSPSVGLSGGAGFAWLNPGRDEPRQNGPAFQLGLEWRRPRASGTVGYRRTFVPSFGFGGTFQNEELRAGLRVALTRWLEWTARGAASDSDPLQAGDPTLRSLSAQSSLALLVGRRLRIEGFAGHVFQDSGLAGGRVGRTRAGVQAAVAQPISVRPW